jgi:hypothetical protein
MHRDGFRAGLTALAFAACALVTTGCDVRIADGGGMSVDLWQGHAGDTWQRTYAVSAGGRVEILNINGEIRAEAAEGTSVEVRAERTVSAGSDEAARDYLARIEMREESGPMRVRIETIVPRGRVGRQKVAFTVRVPAGVHVDLRTVNGGVRLQNVGGEVRATSTNGGVKGQVGAASIIDARTTNGGVELELTGALSPDGRVSLTSVNGGVRLKVPGDTRADVSARCTNGRISVTDLPFDVEGTQSRRRVEGRLNGGGGRIDLQTTNGGVSLGPA